MKYTPAEQRAITRAYNIIRERGPEARPILTCPAAALQHMTLHLAGEDQQREHFAVAYLNAQHELIDIRTEFVGSIDGAPVYPREIARAALELGASAVVLAHNHPSGTERPSQADIAVTRRLQDALGLFDIRVLDHLIVAGARHYSFAEYGEV
jgi:DNA repair protein RadC